MNPEKEIEICGKRVTMRYCAATETGYEKMSGQSSDVFSPVVLERDAAGMVTKVDAPPAKTDDYLKLALSAIVAASMRKGEEPPITAEEIIYDANPTEVTELITSILELRRLWYEVPAVVPANETDEQPKEDQGKNG